MIAIEYHGDNLGATWTEVIVISSCGCVCGPYHILLEKTLN
jgi:hypothetical protein